MSQAEKLLTYTDMSISEIAERIGYGNLSFFSQRFREYFLISPTEYRKKRLPPKTDGQS